MPTGYTAKLAEGEQSFEDFVWSAARAMGALVMMREEPTGAPIPERFEPSDYNLVALRKARAEALRLEGLPEDVANDEAEADYTAALARYEARQVQRKAQLERYNAMLQKVAQWSPPTSEHARFKEFMAQQLRESIRFDCDYSESPPQRLPGAVWREAQLEKARRDITYHANEHMEEVARTENRNQWLAELRKSVPPRAKNEEWDVTK